MPTVKIEFLDGPRQGDQMDLHRVWEFPPSIRVYDGDGFTEYVKKDIYTPKGKKTPIGRYEQSR